MVWGDQKDQSDSLKNGRFSAGFATRVAGVGSHLPEHTPVPARLHNQVKAKGAQPSLQRQLWQRELGMAHGRKHHHTPPQEDVHPTAAAACVASPAGSRASSLTPEPLAHSSAGRRDGPLAGNSHGRPRREVDELHLGDPALAMKGGSRGGESPTLCCFIDPSVETPNPATEGPDPCCRPTTSPESRGRGGVV